MWLGDPYRDDMPCTLDAPTPCAPPPLPLLREDRTEILAPLASTSLFLPLNSGWTPSATRGADLRMRELKRC